MYPLKHFKVRSYEMGLYFRGGEFRGLLGEGTYWFLDPLDRVGVEIVSQRTPQFVHDKLDLIVKSGELKGRAMVIDLKDAQRGLVWIDGRFSGILPPGLYAYWTGRRDVRVEIVDARRPRFEHEDLRLIMRSISAGGLLETFTVGRGCVGVLFLDGTYADALPPGSYAFWRGVADARLVEVDLREASLDVGGQEIMTADKVTLRLNAVVTYRVTDARRAVCATDDARQALYREVQLALRAVVGARDLDALLADKDVVSRETEELLRRRAGRAGPGGPVGGHPRRDPAGRHEGADEQGHRSPQGRRGQPGHPPRGDGRHPQPGQHGQAAGRQPALDAPPRARIAGEDRGGGASEGRARRKGTHGARRQPALRGRMRAHAPPGHPGPRWPLCCRPCGPGRRSSRRRGTRGR